MARFPSHTEISLLFMARDVQRFSLSCLLLFFSALFAQAEVLHVTVEGKDDSACGAVNRPCRSISQAIVNANEEDTIVVGPGRYGDLNNDGDFADPGEEAAEVGFGCYCMLNVSKRLSVESRAGAAETILDASDQVRRVVLIQTDNVTFGGTAKGFTVAGALGAGLEVTARTSGVRVAGNLIKDNRGAGVFVHGDRHVFSDNIISNNRKHGLDISRGNGHEIRRNLIRDNAAGGIHTLANDIHVADNSFVNNDPVRGCGLINNSGAELVLWQNVWKTAGVENKVCNLGKSHTVDHGKLP
jgi:hypothetical protein